MFASKRVILACLFAFLFMAVAPASVLGQSGGGFVYTVNGRVEAFTIDPSSGALTQVPRGLFNTGADPRWLATDPTGHFLYTANAGGSSISAFGIDGTTGGLSLVLGAPYGAPWAPLAVAFDPVGNFVYATDNVDTLTGAASILVYTVNGNGALKAFPSSPIPPNYAPNNITVASNTRSVYVTGCQTGSGSFNDGCNDSPGVVFGFTIGPQGAPQPMPGSPFQVGAHPISIALDPQQQFLYVANMQSSNLSIFSIDGMGALTPVAGSPFATDSFPSSIQVTGTGQFIYVGTFNGFVDGYAVDRSTGALTPVPGSPFRFQNRNGFACGANSMAVDPTSRFLYAVPNGSNFSNNLGCVYQIDGTTGALTFGSLFFPGSTQAIIATAGPQ